MAEVQSPSLAGNASRGSEKESLIARLDELLEKYLDTLDQYQKARLQLTTQLSSGFLSLAQANFNNPSRARYGLDYYDERMQALRTMNIAGEKDDVAVHFETRKPDPIQDLVSETEKLSTADSVGSETGASAKKPDSESQTPMSPKEGNPIESPVKPDEKGHAKEDAKTSTPTSKAPRDPIRWFGILVPPSLRAAQTSFISAVEGPVPRLASLTSELRKQEIDIGRLRKQIRKL